MLVSFYKYELEYQHYLLLSEKYLKSPFIFYKDTSVTCIFHPQAGIGQSTDNQYIFSQPDEYPDLSQRYYPMCPTIHAGSNALGHNESYYDSLPSPLGFISLVSMSFLRRKSEDRHKLIFIRTYRVTC